MPDTKQAGDGLGPLFNERSCAACHNQGGLGGGGPGKNNVQIVNLGTLSGTTRWSASEDLQRALLFPTLEHGKNSLVLHRFGLHPQYAPWRRQRLAFAKPEDADSAEAARAFRLEQLAENGWAPRSTSVASSRGGTFSGQRVTEPIELLPVSLEERNTTALFGAGLLDKVTLKTLQEIAERQPSEVRGRPALLPDGRVGRFGWKGQNTSLADFNENACAVELGLQTPTRLEASLPPIPEGPKSTIGYELHESQGVDITAAEIEALTSFVAALPRPEQIVPMSMARSIRQGEQKFYEVGCAQCHQKSLGSVTGVYSDLLLHRMGGFGSIYYGSTAPPDIASTLPPKPDEFRTPPLWGVADSAPYMHDGSAATLRDAILAHGIQGDPAGKRFRALPANEQQLVIVFLRSLRVPQVRR